MTDQPREKLCELIATYGQALCDDPRRCEALLRDLCEANRREVHVLVSALRERVAADLLAVSEEVPREVLRARLTQRLRDNLGLTEEIARWAVDSWALAIGRLSQTELSAVPANANTTSGPAPPATPSRRPPLMLAGLGFGALTVLVIALLKVPLQPSSRDHEQVLVQRQSQTREQQLGQWTNPGVTPPAREQSLEDARRLDDQAIALFRQDRHKEAIPLAQRSLAIREKAFGPDHPEVATSLIGLAILYDTQGQYAQAELFYKRALAIEEKAFGPDHPEVATLLNGLAVLYVTQGHYAQAEPLVKRALAIREKALGPDHPAVAVDLEIVAGLYRKTGREKAAEELEKRAAAIRAIKR